MFGLKKKTPNFIKSFVCMLNDLFSPVNSFIEKKTRIGGRSRLANRWAKRNPKRFMALYSVIAMTIIIFTLFTGLKYNDGDSASGGEVQIKHENVLAHRFDFLAMDEINRQKIKDMRSELAHNGKDILMEIDSLKSLKQITHSDSLRIAYLNSIINKTFNNINRYESQAN